MSRPARRLLPWASVSLLVLLVVAAATGSALTTPSHHPGSPQVARLVPAVQPSGSVPPVAPTPASTGVPSPPPTTPSPSTPSTIPITATTVAPGLATGTPPAACTASIPPEPSTPSTNEQILVAAGVTSVLLCEYNSLNPPLGLAAERTITDSATLGRLTQEANSGSVPPPGTAQSCPADFGESTDLYFVYKSGSVLRLWVDMGGCAPIIDQYGWSEDWTLVNDLQGLLGS